MNINIFENKLKKILKFSINEIAIFLEAFTHRSLSNEKVDNERTEFLGDAVLELVVTEYLFHRYPSFNEGFLTSIRSALVKTESLAEESKRLGLGELIFMSRGEESSGGRLRPYILANIFESLIGAIYLDNTKSGKSLDLAEQFIRLNLLYKTEDIIKNRRDIDPKTKLQETSQEILKETPRYELLSSNGPDHNKNFIMKVLIKEYEFGRGQGKSKQEAEQEAAKEAISNWEALHKKYFQ